MAILCWAAKNSLRGTERLDQGHPHPELKGIVQPFELGCETTLIPSAVKY
jgi:hypothetical protein